MYELLVALIVVLFSVVKAREHWTSLRVDPRAAIPVKNDPNDLLPTSWNNGRQLYTTDPDSRDGKPVYGLYPDSCAEDKEREGLLCYPRCEPGFYGVGPVCWAESVDVGTGRPVGLEPCPHGWTNDGLICREPLRWDSCKSKFFGLCVGGLRGGRLQGRLNNGGVCDWPQDRGNLPSWLVDKSDPKNYKATHPEKVGGLCFRKCPAEYPVRMAWPLAQRCYKGGRVSYPRGAGDIPCGLRVFGYCLFGSSG